MRFTVLALAVVVVASSTQFPGVTWVKADPAAPPSATLPHAGATAAAVTATVRPL